MGTEIFEAPEVVFFAFIGQEHGVVFGIGIDLMGYSDIDVFTGYYQLSVLIDNTPFAADLNPGIATGKVFDVFVLTGNLKIALFVDETPAGVEVGGSQTFVKGLHSPELGFDHEFAAVVDIAPFRTLLFGHDDFTGFLLTGGEGDSGENQQKQDF